MNSIVNYQMQ